VLDDILTFFTQLTVNQIFQIRSTSLIFAKLSSPINTPLLKRKLNT